MLYKATVLKAQSAMNDPILQHPHSAFFFLSIYPLSSHPAAEEINWKCKNNLLFAGITLLWLSHQTVPTPFSVNSLR